MITLAEKANFIHDQLRGQRSLRLVANGVSVGHSRTLCRNTIREKSVKDQNVMAARNYAVERLFDLYSRGLDLSFFSGKEISFFKDDEDLSIINLTSERTNIFSRGLYEFNYLVQNYTRRVNAVTALFSYGGAALIEQAASGHDISWTFVGGMALLGSYYSQEVFSIYKFVHEHISADTRRGRIKRVLATNFTFNPVVFNPRHVALTRLIAGEAFLGVGDTFLRGLGMWGAALPFTTAIDYVINNKVPMKYKFLAIEAVNLVWATYAAIVSLLR